MEIQIKNAHKSFGKSKIIKDVSMSINKGEIICFLGPSGSGKTTLIRLILGAIKAEKGEITIGEKIVPNLSLFSRIGYMPQNDALYEDLTAKENLEFFAGLYGIKNKDFNKKQDEALSIVNLMEDKNKIVSKFSGGMKKRLSLAIAMQHKPDIFLLDEPTVGIDPILKNSIWKEFIKLKKQGKTLIVSTHVMDEIKECDKAALIYEGRLVEFATIPELLSKTKGGEIEELFLDVKATEGGDAG